MDAEEEDDEDEVFFGPVGFTETCVAKKTQLNSLSPAKSKPLSPLNAEQYVQIFLEANQVAMELEKERKGSGGCSSGSSSSSSGQSESPAAKPSSLVNDPVGEKPALTFQDETAEIPASHRNDRPDARTYKRLVRKEMRSPRRGTYTIAVSPAHAPPPPHLPLAGECVSALCRGQPESLRFSAAASQPKEPVSRQQQEQRSGPRPGGATATQRESKLPVRGGRRSKLPTRATTKRALPKPQVSLRT